MSASLQLLGAQLGIEKNELKIALTHQSFFKVDEDLKANSRLIFAGMFAFKGILAHVLYNFYPNSGTQLQHILGNLCRNEYLESLYDKWNLKKHIRAGTKFNIQVHKHLFVYAIMGCISQAEEPIRHRFIFRYFLCSDTEHLFSHRAKNKNVLHQLNHLALPVLGEYLNISTLKTEDGSYCTNVETNTNLVICSEISLSYRYSRKKAIKEALSILAQIDFDKFISETDYLERLKKREADKKQLRLLAVQQKLDEKQALLERRREQIRQLRKARDIERKKSQAELKKRKAEKAAIKKAKEANTQRPVSANKRRFLEDKKK